MTNPLLSDPTRVLCLENLASESGIEAPFPARPFQVVSLLDMLPFYADLFHTYCFELEGFLNKLRYRATKRGEAAVVDQTEINEALAIINKLYDECKRVNLSRTLEIFDLLRKTLPGYYAEDFNLTKLHWDMNEVSIAIGKDLKDNQFLCLLKDERKYWEIPEPFGLDVKQNFPKASIEITTAGTCYALNNYNGCVFHLMRAVEYGARVILKELGIQEHDNMPIELCDWGGLQAALNAQIPKLSRGKRGNLQIMSDYEFYSYPIQEFEKFRIWRNKVSHLREGYLPGQSRDIMDATERYMRHLATRLDEVGLKL